MNSYPGKPPRYKQDHSLYFLTFCTLRRKPLLHIKGIPEFLIEEITFYEKNIHKLVAYTIMPDHIHMIVEIEHAETLSIFLRDFKRFTSKGIKSRMKEIGMNLDGHIWQPGTMDHCIRMSWENRDYLNHLSYVFYNSIKHLNIPPQNFPYHNFTDVVAQGMLPPDFCVHNAQSKFEIYE